MQAAVPDLKSMPSIRGMYQLHHAAKLAAAPFNLAAALAGQYYDLPFVRAMMPGFADNMRGSMAVAEYLTKTNAKPAFNLGVEEEVIREVSTPFCDLLHFKQPNIDHSKPKVLLVAPMSGHFATLLRDTVRTMMQTRDVYITDWKCASQVPLSQGDFDVDDYINTLKNMIRYFKGHVHVKAVCQPSVQTAAAIAAMHMDGEKHVPISAIISGGPIDTRINPTMVNTLATNNGADAFNKLIDIVPVGLPGAGREVYPGFLQLHAFKAMNPDRHMQALLKYFRAVAEDDIASVQKFKAFYDEYDATLDMTASFYLRTIKSVFVEHHLPKGEFWHINENGQRSKIDSSAVSRTALMTVEGEKDDITGLGQSSKLADMWSNVPNSHKRPFIQTGVGHYGIFSGSVWRGPIANEEERFRFQMETNRLVAA